MFEDALLDSSLRHRFVLHRIHYLLAGLAGVLAWGAGVFLLPWLQVPTNGRALYIAAPLAGTAVGLYVLMLCYVGEDARQQHWWAWPWVVLTALLNLPGFLIYLVCSAYKTGDWRRAAMPLAYVAESLLVGVLILVPLIYTRALPNALLIAGISLPLLPEAPPSPPSGPPARPLAHQPAVDPFVQPIRIPPNIRMVNEPPEPPPAPTGLQGTGVIGVPNGFGQGNGSVIGAAPWNTAASAPPPALPRPAPRPPMIRVPSEIIAAKAIFHPKPDYPQIAIIAHIQGTVVLQAIIAKDGSIEHLQVLSGPSLLAGAAVNAVKTWRYQPTLLNSEPVEVMTEIDVIFNLGE